MLGLFLRLDVEPIAGVIGHARLGQAKPDLRHLDENDARLIALAHARHLEAFLRKAAILIGPVHYRQYSRPEPMSCNAEG